MENRMLVVLDCCVGCHACEIACRQENGLTYETGSKWCHVVTLKPRRVEEELHLDYFPAMCVHCEDPLCKEVCPEGAIVKREDGTVLVEEATCNGCGLCVHACPYGAMNFNEVTKKAGKCNLCLERLQWGMEPTCVQHCIGGALRYVTQAELEEITRGKHTVLTGKFCYASSKWKLGQLKH